MLYLKHVMFHKEIIPYIYILSIYKYKNKGSNEDST